MPSWKYVANRFLTAAENLLLGAKLSEYHTGYRAFSKELLQTVDLSNNSDDFVFDNQMLAQTFWHGFTIGEVSCPTKILAKPPRSISAAVANTVWAASRSAHNSVWPRWDSGGRNCSRSVELIKNRSLLRPTWSKVRAGLRWRPCWDSSSDASSSCRGLAAGSIPRGRPQIQGLRRHSAVRCSSWPCYSGSRRRD